MNLEELVLWADLVQAVAVVATLLFVGFQVRYSTRIARMTAAQTSAQMLAENLGRVTESPELAALITGSRDQQRSLNAADQMRISNFLTAAFRNFEVLHAHRRYNIYEEELWQGSAARLRMMISMPRIREWWAENQPLYAASFRTHVNSEIEDLAAQQPN